MGCGDSSPAADDDCMGLTPGGRRLIRRFKVSYGTPLAANSGVVAGVANPSIKLTHYQLLKIGPDRRGVGSARNQSLFAVRPSQITHVVNSHYHIDHCGG